MKILIRQFLGKNHSWSVSGWGIAQSFKKLGHQVHLFSTDGTKHLPEDLKENLIGYVEEDKHNQVYGQLPDKEYDCQFSYTAMKNFPFYLKNGDKNRFGTWVYEWAGKNVLPNGFAKHHKSCDVLCAPSQFGKQVFMDSGIPEEKISVIPHGINVDDYKKESTIKLPTKKTFKILANIAQNHLRKNIPGLLEAYGKAFTNNDNVCLILKAKEKPIKQAFDVSLNACLKDFNVKFPQHAEVKVFSEFIEDVSALYRSIDAVYTLSHCEGYYMVGVEALASGKICIAPKWGGQLDFLNDSNSLLVEGKEVRANPKSMYWEPKNNAIWFEPSIDDAIEKLRYAYQNYQELNSKVEQQREKIYQDYSWQTIAGNILKMCK